MTENKLITAQLQNESENLLKQSSEDQKILLK